MADQDWTPLGGLTRGASVKIGDGDYTVKSAEMDDEGNNRLVLHRTDGREDVPPGRVLPVTEYGLSTYGLPVKVERPGHWPRRKDLIEHRLASVLDAWARAPGLGKRKSRRKSVRKSRTKKHGKRGRKRKTIRRRKSRK